MPKAKITSWLSRLLKRDKHEISLPWIVDGKCINDGRHMCNIGYACDGCPYNKD